MMGGGALKDGLDAGASLRNDVVRIIRERTGMIERYAVPLADDIVTGLACLHGGGSLSIPLPAELAKSCRDVKEAAGG